MVDESDPDSLDNGTTIWCQQKHHRMMNVAADVLYDVDEVNRTTVLERLLEDHPLIPDWCVENDGKKVVKTDGGSTEQIDLSGVKQN